MTAGGGGAMDDGMQDGRGGSGGDGDPAEGCSPAPEECDPPDQCGALIEKMHVAAELPTALGGTLVDGTYVMTQHNWYHGLGGSSGPSGELVQATMLLSGGSFASVTSADGYPSTTSSGTTAMSGTSFWMHGSCPATFMKPLSYTAVGGTLHLYDSANDLEWVYARLP
jgi:hypothetical protein